MPAKLRNRCLAVLLLALLLPGGAAFALIDQSLRFADGFLAFFQWLVVVLMVLVVFTAGVKIKRALTKRKEDDEDTSAQ